MILVFCSSTGLPIIDEKSLSGHKVIDDRFFWKVYGANQGDNHVAVKVIDRALLDHEGAIHR